MILTFDLGTTNFKAGLFSPDHGSSALVHCPTPIDRSDRQTLPGRAEIEPAAFFDAITALCRELHQQYPDLYRQVRAISYASQANTVMLRDDADRALTPMMVWSDRRAEAGSATIDALNALPERYTRTGVPLINWANAPAKLAWLSEHQPETLGRARRVTTLDDELVLWLTGQHVTEAGLAALTGLLDVHRLEWLPDALDQFAQLGLTRSAWPTPVRAGTDLGVLRPAIADALQLPRQARVIVGCLDQYAGAIAAGNVRPGRASETTGTALAVVCCADHFDASLEHRGIYQGPAGDDARYYRMAFSTISANLLEHYRAHHCPEITFAQLDQLAQANDPASFGCELDIQASEKLQQPVFDTPPPSPGARARIIMHAVARRLAQHIDALYPDKRQRPDRVVSLGGAARSALWLAIKADTLGMQLIQTGFDEPACTGAAICAHAGLLGIKIEQAAAYWPGIKEE
jgi:sugar (pentulose or hexulose) kinase